MEKSEISNKMILMILSVILVIFSLAGNIISSNMGGVSLYLFESFYVYVGAMGIAVYSELKKKKIKIWIIMALLTYIWTLYLILQMINYLSHISFSFGFSFYIYLLSAIVLIPIIFMQDNVDKSLSKKKDDEIDNKFGLDRSCLIFAKFFTGYKDIPYNTTILLINNLPDRSLDINYEIDKVNNVKKINYDDIKDISFKIKVRTSFVSKNIEDNESKSILMSMALFGGNPILQTFGKGALDNLFSAVSNNYDKVKLNTEYEISLKLVVGNEEKNVAFISSENPEMFINNFVVNQNKNSN